MKCKRVRSLIPELVMGTIGEEEKRNLDFHLKGCPRCERERAAFGDLISSLKSLSIPDPGEEFWKTLPLRVEREIARADDERSLRRWLKGILAGDWLLQPGKSVYAFVSMAIIMIMTVLLFYPRYAVREGDMVSRNGEEVTALVSHPAEDSIGYEDDEGAITVENLNLHELNLLYSSLVSSVHQKKADQELLDGKMGGAVSVDIAAELNDLNPDELRVLSQKLSLRYPEIQEKGVL